MVFLFANSTLPAQAARRNSTLTVALIFYQTEIFQPVVAMSLLLIIVVLILLFGGGGGYYGYNRGYYGGNGLGCLGIIVILLIVFALFGHHSHYY